MCVGQAKDCKEL